MPSLHSSSGRKGTRIDDNDAHEVDRFLPHSTHFHGECARHEEGPGNRADLGIATKSVTVKM